MKKDNLLFVFQFFTFLSQNDLIGNFVQNPTEQKDNINYPTKDVLTFNNEDFKFVLAPTKLNDVTHNFDGQIFFQII